MFDLLGTKIVLREDRDFVNQLQRQNLQSIKREQGQRLCKKIRAFKYVECSALTQKGLKQVCLFFLYQKKFYILFIFRFGRFLMMLFEVFYHLKQIKYQNHHVFFFKRKFENVF